MARRGIVELLIEIGVLVFGASFHALEILTWYFVGVGRMGYMSMCMLIVAFRTFCNTCGVYNCIVWCVWLCMHIIDVRSPLHMARDPFRCFLKFPLDEF